MSRPTSLALKRALMFTIAGICLAALATLGEAPPVAARRPASRAQRTTRVTVPSAGARRCQVAVNGRVRAILKSPGQRSVTIELRFAARPAHGPAAYRVAVSCPPDKVKRLTAPGPLASAQMLTSPPKPVAPTPTPTPTTPAPTPTPTPVAPLAPGALSASSGNTTITLSWAPSTDSSDTVAGYDVYRDGVRVGQSSSASYTDTGLVNGTLYSYYVRAYDAAGNLSPASTTVSATPILPSLPAQGIFDSCDIDAMLSECITRIQTIDALGLKVDVQPVPNDDANLGPYLAAMNAAGVGGMWEITDPNWWGYDPSANNLLADYPTWASACGCTTNDQLLAFIVSALQPATYGWYVADDTQSPQNHVTGLTQFDARLRQLAPGAVTLIGSCCNTGYSMLDAVTAVADLAGQEDYPLFGQTDSPATTQQLAASNAASAVEVQAVADAHNVASAFILQSFSWGECAGDASAVGLSYPDVDYPSADELLAMRNAVLDNAHPQLLLWYDLEESIGWPTGTTPSDCTAPADPQTRSADLSAAVTAPYPTP